MRKKYSLKVLVTAATLCCGYASFGQSTARAQVGAQVVAPIGIVRNADMNFGNAAVSQFAGGAIILAPNGSRSVTGTGVTLPVTAGSVAPAYFTVTGAAGYAFVVTLPGSAMLNGPGSSSMMISGFTSLPSGTGSLNSSGVQTLAVGATLNLSAAQPAGTYTSVSAVPVTVNYY